MAEDAASRLAHMLGIGDIAVYGQRARVRQDDLLVRSQASDALGRASSALRDLAARYHEERIPPSSREHPFPPQEALAALRSIEQRQRAVQDAEVQLRSAPFPAEDFVWERLRSAELQLDLLISLDIALIERAHEVERLCGELSPGDAESPAAVQAIDTAVSALRASLRERTALLAPPI